jgi:SHS family lactate transporter-like MFS transporter
VRTLLATARSAFAHHWLIFVYLVLLMTGFNFLAHGSQDLYPTFLTSQLKFSPSLVTITTVVANCGALIGGILVGYFSTFFGRRLSIIVILIVGAALIPAYVLPRNVTIIAGVFFQQFCVQGAWGVVPIYLLELSPERSRSFVVGTSYQLGNLISAASSTIEATGAQHFPLHISSNGSDQNTYDYGKVMGIALACIYIYLLIVVLLGPEKRNIDETKDRNRTTAEIQLEAPEGGETVPKA